MTQEEKARAYDEALERAKTLYENANGMILKKWVEQVFPELGESEDEKIRKEIVRFIQMEVEDEIVGNKWLAWLEKQGERKTPQWMIDFLDNYRRKIGCSLDHDEARDVDGKILCIMQWLENQGVQIDIANKEYWRGYREGKKEILDKYAEIEKQNGQDILEDAVLDGNEDGLIAETIRFKNEKQSEQKSDKVEPKFHEGEWITNGDYTWKIVEVKPLDYILQSQDGNVVDDTISHVDEQFHSFTIQDAKHGDVLVNWNNTIFIFKAIEDETLKFHIAYNEKWDAIKIPSTKLSHLGFPEPQFEFHPATKEQRDTLMKAMVDAGYEWSDKDRKLIKIVK